MSKLTVNYVVGKETKGTFRFAPDAEGQEVIGNATIYLPKEAIKNAGIAPNRGFEMQIAPK